MIKIMLPTPLENLLATVAASALVFLAVAVLFVIDIVRGRKDDDER